MQTFKRWLAHSPLGGWFKGFLSGALTAFIVAGSDVSTLSSVTVLKGLTAAGVAGMLPLVVNWLNSSDGRYGGRRTGRHSQARVPEPATH